MKTIIMPQYQIFMYKLPDGVTSSSFTKKMSFWQFCYRNQSYWEEKTLKITTRPKLKTFDEFEQDIRDGYYDRVKMCLSLKSLIKVLEMFPNHRAELIDMFNYSMSELVDENLWK